MASARADELLRQILANPDDLAVRAIYADVLQADGDPRGEFIALELANDPAHAGRRASLLGAHAARWWPELARHRIRTRAGFLERVAGDAGELAAARAVFAREPVRDVELVDAHADTYPGSELAWQARVTRFTARGFLQKVFYAICKSPLGAQLEALDVGGCYLDRDIVAIGAHLPACRQLSLAGNRHLGRHLPKLLHWQHLGNVEVLDLSQTSVTPELVKELLALDLHSLRVLRLSNNPLGALAPRTIADALPRMPALARVELMSCDIEPFALAPLAGLEVLHADVPALLTLDLVGAVVELVRVGTDRWAVKVDGKQRTIRWQHVQRDDRREAREGPWQMAEIAPLERIAIAIACGTPRELRPSGEHAGASIAIHEHMGYAYNTGVYTRESARFVVSPTAATVAITFDEYVSID